MYMNSTDHMMLFSNLETLDLMNKRSMRVAGGILVRQIYHWYSDIPFQRVRAAVECCPTKRAAGNNFNFILWRRKCSEPQTIGAPLFQALGMGRRSFIIRIHYRTVTSGQ